MAGSSWQPASGHSWAGISRCWQDGAALRQPFWGHCQYILIALLFFPSFISFSDVLSFLLPLYCNDGSVVTSVKNDFRKVCAGASQWPFMLGQICELKYGQRISIFLFSKSLVYHVVNWKAIAFLWCY